MVALGGDLYVYGGCKETSACPPGSRQFLSDIIVARARNGVVSQPWKQLAISESMASPMYHVNSVTSMATLSSTKPIHQR